MLLPRDAIKVLIQNLEAMGGLDGEELLIGSTLENQEAVGFEAS